MVANKEGEENEPDPDGLNEGVAAEPKEKALVPAGVAVGVIPKLLPKLEPNVVPVLNMLNIFRESYRTGKSHSGFLPPKMTNNYIAVKKKPIIFLLTSHWVFLRLLPLSSQPLIG